MEVEIISKTAQKFNGETYYLCGSYYQRKGKRLHREVWTFHHGEIPEGYHVHHADKDRSNNQIENLVLMRAEDHLSSHASEPEHVETSRQNIGKAIQAARAWHGTAEGAAWHSLHAKEYWASAPMLTYTCSCCGKEFQTKNVSYTGNHFCGRNCRARFRNRRLRRESQERKASGNS